MPANYLATIRYNIIDRCIRDKYRIWQWDHLAHAISVELKEFHGKGKIPSKRTIMADIAAMRSGELGYTAPIIHDRANGYRYANPHFSIHHLSLPAPLINDLREGIALIHQLTKNEKLQRISSSLTRICNYLHIKYDETFQQLIYFEHSLNEPGQRWLDRVYEYTYDRKCMRILYQPFGTKECTHFIAPAFIKEYNNRWYVFGYDFNLDKIVNLSLDRITEIQPSLRPFFIPDNFSHDLHFKHLYGVTIPDDATPVLIRFSTDIPLSHYMDTKPIHTSQRKVATSEKESTYELYVYDNYEIRSKLRSFGNDLKILSPASLKKKLTIHLNIVENKKLSQGFITSRYGKIEFVEVYSYQYTFKLLQKKDKKQNLISWLTANKALRLFRFTNNGFETLSPMPDENWQYFSKGIKSVVPPFDQIPLFSQYLQQIFSFQLQEKFQKSGYDFVYSHSTLMDFKLDLCFNFYVELFDDGRFLIHFYASSHITMAHDKIQTVINIVKSMSDNNDQYYPKFYISDNKTGRSKAIHPLSKKSLEQLYRFKLKFPDYKYTFDYQFMGKYFPKSLSSFMAKSKIKLSSIHTILNKASSHLEAVNGLKLSETNLLPVKLNKVKPEMNLMIGNDKIVSKLSATYYSGLFRPLTKAIILPILCGQDITVLPKVKQLTEQHFNSNGSVQWLPALVGAGPTIDFAELERIKNEYLSAFIIIITEGTLPHTTIGILREKKLQYQIIQLPADNFILSNFVVKCLHKMGAKIALLKDSGLKKDGYIVGLDMGHYHGSKSEPGFSTLVMVFFTAAGEHIYTSKVERLPLNEALQSQSLTEAFTKFKNYLIRSKRNMPSHFIFHRDGKLHVNDHLYLTETVQNLFNNVKMDIVEIIKSGHPYIFTMENHHIKNAVSGQFWEVKDKDYALLITNDQETVPGEVLKPIVIKRKYGNLPFETIVSQVYWYCKLYTNNIYYPSRLPATTELANNRAGTGSKEYKPSFKKE